MLTNTTSVTIECWATQTSANTWATIWDFADNGNINFELCPFPNRNGGNMITAFTPNGGEADLNSSVSFPNGTEQNVALTVNGGTLLSQLYTNGTLVGGLTLPNSTYLPRNIGGNGGTVQDMLGNDTYGDEQFSGTIYEFRIWDGAVTPLYLAISSVAGTFRRRDQHDSVIDRRVTFNYDDDWRPEPERDGHRHVPAGQRHPAQFLRHQLEQQQSFGGHSWIPTEW